MRSLAELSKFGSNPIEQLGKFGPSDGGTGDGDTGGNANGGIGGEGSGNGGDYGDGWGVSQDTNPGITGGYAIGYGDNTDGSGGPTGSKYSGIGPAEETTIDIGAPEIDNVTKGTDYGNTTVYGIGENLMTVGTHHNVLGIDFWTDEHYINNQKLGGMDELAADTLEMLGLSVTQLNIDITKGVVGLAVGLIMGAPAAVSAIRGVSLAGNIGVATGTITEEENRNIQAIAAFAELGLSAKSMIENVSALSEMGKYMSTPAKIMGAALIGIQAYQFSTQVNSFIDKFGEYGVDPMDISEVDLRDFDNDMVTKGVGNISGIAAIGLLAKWKLAHDNVDKNVDPIDAEDIFKKMGGGIIYNAFFGGSVLYHPMNPPAQNIAAVRGPIRTDKFAMYSIYQEDLGFSRNTKYAAHSTSVHEEGSAISKVKHATIRQIRELQEQDNKLIEQYQNIVNEWNTASSEITRTTDSFNSLSKAERTKSKYDEVTSRINTLKASFDFEANRARLNSLGTQIEMINKKIKKLSERL